MINIGNEEQPEKQGNLAMGIVGTLVAGFVGMMLWYGLIKLTHYEIGIAAWGVGALTGIGARMFMPSGGLTLGIVAALCAFVAIIGGQFLVLNDEVNKFIGSTLDGVYENQMAYAKKAVQAETDEQVRKLIAEEASDEGKKTDPAAVTAAEVKEFREKELPKLRDFAKGKPAKAEFEAEMRGAFLSTFSRWEIMKNSVGIFTALWIFLGVGSAYKIAANEDAE